MKKITIWTMSIVAAIFAFFAINGTITAHAAAAGKDVSTLNLSAKLKETVFTYDGGMIRPEYMISGVTDWTDKEYQCDNYSIGYRYNVNAGTGSIVAVGKGAYSGQTTLATFTILPRNIDNIPNLTIDFGAAAYTGKPVIPPMKIKVGSRELTASVDYTITAENNINIGYTTGVINFIGNYTGKRSIYFKIDYAPINNVIGTETAAGNVLKWDKVNCDKISIFRFDQENNTVKVVGTTTDSEFLDTSAPQLTSCTYTIMSEVTYNGKKYTATSRACTVNTTLKVPNVSVTANNNVITLRWDSNPQASGYFVYMDDLLEANLRGSDNNTYTVRVDDPSAKHSFGVASYASVNDRVVVGSQGTASTSKQETSILRNANKGDTRSFKIINSQGKTDIVSTVKLSDNDVAILEKFAKENFTDDMTDYEKLAVTIRWINTQVTYATTAADWKTIGSRSYVDVIFNSGLGQCAQYNGAMVSMMRYLGYEANLIQGYRGTAGTNQWQHFWGEIEINGVKYITEAGNIKRYGPWMFLLVPYGQADGKYIVNGRNV